MQFTAIRSPRLIVMLTIVFGINNSLNSIMTFSSSISQIRDKLIGKELT